MIEAGQFHTLTVTAVRSEDVVLAAGDDSLSLPRAEAPAQVRAGDRLKVFVYTADQGAPRATTRTPKAVTGEIACLTVTAAGRSGVWLDWGLAEDLFLPRHEQQGRLEPGWKALVIVIDDPEYGVIASARLNDFLHDEAPDLAPGAAVGLWVADETDLGWKVVVDNRYWGVVYADDSPRRLRKGEALTGYVRRQRKDNRLDISLTPLGYARVDDAAKTVLERLEAEGGYMAVGDDTPPETIRAIFGLSKKAFKQAIGTLFRERKIVIEPRGIRRTGA